MSVWGHKRITIKPKRLSKDERADLDQVREELEELRPRSRSDCREGIRAFLEKRPAGYKGPYYDNPPFGGSDR